jgi:hypothetical protein
MSEFELPNYTTSECSDGPKSGAVVLKEFVVRWDYNGDGSITVSLNNSDDKLIQSLEHTKSKV